MSETFNRRCTPNLQPDPSIIYEATSKTALISVYFCNKSLANEVDVMLIIGNNLGDTYLANNVPLPVNGSWEAVANRIIMLPGDLLYSSASESNGADVTVSVVEGLP